MNELQEMPDTIGRMTSLEHLTLDNCSKLRTLQASIMHLSRLQTLCILDVPLEDLSSNIMYNKTVGKESAQNS